MNEGAPRRGTLASTTASVAEHDRLAEALTCFAYRPRSAASDVLVWDATSDPLDGTVALVDYGRRPPPPSRDQIAAEMAAALDNLRKIVERRAAR